MPQSLVVSYSLIALLLLLLGAMLVAVIRKRF